VDGEWNSLIVEGVTSFIVEGVTSFIVEELRV